MEKVLEVVNVSKYYKKKKVIQNVSFKIEKGEVIGLIGPNGAGKTTLMKIIMNLINKYEGEIILQDVKHRKKRIGCIIENPGFYPNLTGLDNLRYFSEVSGGFNEQHVLSIIELLNINGFVNKKVKHYSLGMKQRLGIAQALLNKPDLLILDEPTNGLDPEGVVEMRNVIKDIVKKYSISVLISSHILSEIENICDKVLFLQNGSLINTIDLKNITDCDLLNYKIETNYPDKLKDFLKNKMIPILKEEENSVTFKINRNDIEELIIHLVNNGIRFSAVYPSQENLESQFFKLLGGNKIE
ncbi:bacitracin ABC transporter ATP-binding protein [Bacillus cereus]|nr:bacitracin ABC transporter ATP-binding protein [Bacillus cereus]PGU69807.1 bacitracin ABC transporter ATP-binding protein [Bacillus cereus]